MRFMLKLTAIISGFFSLYLAYNLNKKHHDVEIPSTPIENNKTINFEIVDKINKKNEKTRTLIVKSMPVKIKSGTMSFRLNADLFHEKDKFFRLIVSSKLTGKEMDLGSNKDLFWFWSKRINPPSLYFAKHEDLWKTNLKTPLNPKLMIESLNIGIIDQKKITAHKEDDSYLYLYEKGTVANGDDCIIVTIIDKIIEKVYARKLLDVNSNLIVNTIYNGNNVFIEWKDENASMQWDMTNKEINGQIPDVIWKLPDYKTKVDMGQSLVE